MIDWTAIPPTRHGYYWHRSEKHGLRLVRVVTAFAGHLAAGPWSGGLEPVVEMGGRWQDARWPTP